jgi:hypothetical protein
MLVELLNPCMLRLENLYGGAGGFMKNNGSPYPSCT